MSYISILTKVIYKWNVDYYIYKEVNKSGATLRSAVGGGRWRSAVVGGAGGVGGGRLVLEQQRGVLEAQVRAQRVDAAVGGGAVGAERALRRVRVEVVPAVGHLLAAGLAAPQRGALRRRHEHAVVRVLRRVRVRPLCNTHNCCSPRPNRPTLPSDILQRDIYFFYHNSNIKYI